MSDFVTGSPLWASDQVRKVNSELWKYIFCPNIPKDKEYDSLTQKLHEAEAAEKKAWDKWHEGNHFDLTV